MTLVSVIIPVYGAEHFLKQSLKSVINQNCNNLEIIVVNDGSKDESKIIKILNNYKDDNIKYISYTKNKGVSYALNIAIKKSKGKFICWLSHDDFFLKKKILTQLQYFKKKRKDVILCSNFKEYNEILKKKINRKIPIKYFKNTLLSLITDDRLHGCTFMIPKKIFTKVGYFDQTLKHTQDYDLWIRIAKYYEFKHQNFFFLVSRIHSYQSSKVSKKDAIEEKIKLFKKYYPLIRNDIIKLNLKEFFVLIYRMLKKKLYKPCGNIVVDYFRQ